MSKKTVKIIPSWEACVRIYMMVLENPKASEEAKEAARADIIKLARHVDAIKKVNEPN